MRSLRRQVLFALLVLAVLVAGCVVEEDEPEPAAEESTAAAAPAAAEAPAAAAPGPDLPYVVPLPHNVDANFADFSWQEFIALNWPVALGAGGVPMRGEPDRGLPLGGQPGRPRVWETWKTDWELFGFGGPNPPQPSAWSDWTTPGVQPCPGMTLPPGAKVLTSQGTGSSKIRGLNQAFIGPLVDRNRNYARYEIRLNQNEYETIRRNQWYIRSKIPNPVVFDSSVPGSYGAIELKASWRELTSADDPSRYHVIKAWKLDPGERTCVDALVGLIGLHIAHKTEPFSQWVWSTFEHVDNVPANPPGTPAPGVRYSFNNGTGTPPAPNGYDRVPAKLTANTPLPPPNDPARNPVQVTRFERTPQWAADANARFRGSPPVKGTVWENYVLVSAQWPRDPASFKIGGKYPDDAGKPFPVVGVANTTMETYFQNLPVTDAKNSCMSCHYLSAAKDFSYLFLDAWSPPSAALTEEAVPEELRLLEEALAQPLPDDQP